MEVALPVVPPAEAIRPADILLPTKGAHPLAIDVGVSHPLRASAPRLVRSVAGESAARHEDDKRSAVAAKCKEYGWRFQPVCFESTGAWGPGASYFLRHTAGAIITRSGDSAQEVFAKVGGEMALTLIKGCAEMLLAGCGATMSLPR